MRVFPGTYNETASVPSPLTATAFSRPICHWNRVAGCHVAAVPLQPPLQS